MPWYDGPTLMQYIEEIDVDGSDYNKSLRFPVQWVNRPDLNFRGFCGCLAQGTVRLGDAVRVLPSGVITKIKSIYHGFNHVKKAVEGNAVTLTLDDEVDVSRGDVIVSLDAPFEMANQFEAKLLWLNDNPLFPGRQYILKIGTKEVIATVNSIKYSIDVNSGGHLVAKLLDVNDIGVVNIITSEPILCEEYSSSRTLGGFILIDKQSFATAGAGMIDFALRRSGNINWQKLDVNKILRSGQKNQTPKCFWLTGLSGSGKSTIANLLERRLFSENKHTYILDGDNLRYGLNKNLGFNQSDRVENIRRVAEVAKLMVDAGLVVIVSAISPFRDDRNMARSLFDEDEFVEIFVDASIDVCEKRDVKGLYLKARQGQLKNFTGIDSPYEPPENPEITLRTEDKSIDDCVNQLINYFHLCQ
jgi:bifunctional enzyme CysN/CysC